MNTDVRNFSDAALETAIERCESSLARVADNMSLSSKYRKARMKMLQQRLDDLLAEQERRNWKQGALIALRLKDDWEIDTTILFKRVFSTGSKTYTYAAVKCANGLWAVTGRGVTNISYEDLINNYLARAYEETGELWVATEWRTVLDGE